MQRLRGPDPKPANEKPCLRNAEDNIRVVLEGLKGEKSIAELCRREGIAPNLYYTWSKEFLEAGKRRPAGDTKREASSPEVNDLRHENSELKHAVAPRPSSGPRTGDSLRAAKEASGRKPAYSSVPVKP